MFDSEDYLMRSRRFKWALLAYFVRRCIMFTAYTDAKMFEPPAHAYLCPEGRRWSPAWH